ncbi:uncharacterized protein LOC132182766 isoform X1 [Corylus avellana]|uniref:uncharacterized protein LOC132182766 isoform X1 n=1 Tax=Corylus avellana TaxID=13451 RepID=UPI00286B58DF|nr:uncharacterized protein LOC132182766 isoform X1 [Corylus avellana]
MEALNAPLFKIPKLFESIPRIPKFRSLRCCLKSESSRIYSEGRYSISITDASSTTYNLDKWLLHQEKYWDWNIVTNSGNKITGFGEDGKHIFRQLAHKIRSLHLGGYYCGSLFKSIRISHGLNIHDLNVTFSTVPVKAKNDDDLMQGIMNDTLQFRSLVAKMIEIEFRDTKKLSMGILLFFSEIFKDRLKSKELQDVKDYSFWQMFHPVFFDSSNRTNFMHLIAQYREINCDAFDENLNLCDDVYELAGWTHNLSKKSSVYEFLTRNSHLKGDQYINSIPTLIRNTLVHFKDSNEGMKQKSQEEIENAINQELPDICAKLLDCLMRNLNHPPSFFGCRLVDHFEKPMGLYTRPYQVHEMMKGG